MRDLITPARHRCLVRSGARLDARVEYSGSDPILRALAVTPHTDGLAALLGYSASTGYRRRMSETTSARPGSGEYLLLDEVPVCSLVSGYSILHAGARGDQPVPLPRNVHGANACAGFIAGGTIMTAIDAAEGDAVSTGPLAPPIVNPSDPAGWHDLPTTLAPDSIRRWRRTDVWRNADHSWTIDSHYRDSHMAPGAVETVLHEYTVEARVDEDCIVTSCTAAARVLPFVECIPAARSASRLEGLSLEELRRTVRQNLTGVSTCTHLNDQLRGLEDVAHLIGLLEGTQP